LPCLKKVLWFDSLSPFLIILSFFNYLFLVRSSCSKNPNFLVFFIFPSGPSASFANCQQTSVDSACLNTQFWFTACHRRRRPRHCRFRRSRCFCLAASTDTAIIHSTAAIPVVRSCCLQPLSAVSVRHRCLYCRLHCYPRAAASSEAIVHSHRQPSLLAVAASATTDVLHSAQPPFSTFAAASVHPLPLFGI